VEKSVRSALALLVVGALVSALALAHHSLAMYDFARLVSIRGTVKTFQWTNPHVVLRVDVPEKAGEPAVTWSLELTNPADLARSGWTPQAFAPGNEVIVQFNPLRNGNHGGALVKATQVKTGAVFATDLRGR